LIEKATLLFGERILPFDVPAAKAYATIVSRGGRAGRAIGIADGQIAAIAATRDFIVATRNAGPFQAGGVRVIDPWT
jgi:predicted nucleic acid-binding protein